MNRIKSGTRRGGRARSEGHAPLLKVLSRLPLSSPFSSSSFLNAIQAKIKQNRTKHLLARFIPWAVSFQPLDQISNALFSSFLVLPTLSIVFPNYQTVALLLQPAHLEKVLTALGHLVLPDLHLINLFLLHYQFYIFL